MTPLTPADLWAGPVFHDAPLPGDYMPLGRNRGGLRSPFLYPARFTARCADKHSVMRDIALLTFTYLDGRCRCPRGERGIECDEHDYVLELAAAHVATTMNDWGVVAFSRIEERGENYHDHILEVVIGYKDWVRFNLTEMGRSSGARRLGEPHYDVFTSVVDQMLCDFVTVEGDIG